MISIEEKEYFSALTKKCELGDISAMEALATFYYEEHPELMNDPTTKFVVDYYEKAATAGNQRACLNLGTIYYNGTYAQQNFAKAIDLFNLALLGDSARIAAIADAKLGDCYFYGNGVDKDLSKAFDYYLEGVLRCNHPVCLYKLGDMYRSGDFVNQSLEKAYFIYCKAKASSDMHFLNDSYAAILVRLAEAKIDGLGTDIDISGAKKYLKMAQRSTYKSTHPEDISQKIDYLIKKVGKL